MRSLQHRDMQRSKSPRLPAGGSHHAPQFQLSGQVHA
jgi:hypothetical protein